MSPQAKLLFDFFGLVYPCFKTLQINISKTTGPKLDPKVYLSWKFHRILWKNTSAVISAPKYFCDQDLDQDLDQAKKV
jgi:hypothetical protein